MLIIKGRLKFNLSIFIIIPPESYIKTFGYVYFHHCSSASMKNRIDVDEKLKLIGLGGCWHAGDSGRSYDTYESLRRHETGPYRYLCGKDAKIEDPRKYEFFNEETGKGYIMPGGCWFSPSGNRAYDSLDECSRSHDDCKCTCTDDYDKAFRIQGEIPNLKSKAAKERRRDSKGHFI